ncbi:MAG TPA: SusC/RagA family TonB-linked outer membrane protein [Chitinophagaceae bacterium]|nr:MAG: TonB-dependent receptor [Bacteroidetes bacterium OLB11]HMN33575.1 SusC/RagA family TonB-linked outer membrane protein [Chitinophagaceae bacterium]
MRKLLFLILIFLTIGIQSWAQSDVLRGKILDDKGESIIGATVRVKGANKGTTSDNNGNFMLNVEEGEFLIISAIGMKSIEVQADNGMVVKMQTDAKVLRETVVTALGVKKEKRALGYSVSDVKSDALQKSGEINVIEALAGKAAGAQVTSSAGTPGASSKILLRGNSTFTGNNEPLFVIDGIPVDNSTSQPVAGDYPYNENLAGVNESNRGIDINPDDIESISVLKGPAAAALYGARGGNGAIVITTKKGRKKKGIGITYNTSVEFTKVNKLPKLQSTYAQGSGGNYSTYNPGPDGIVNTADDNLGNPNSWGPRFDTSSTLHAYDNFGAFFKTGHGYTNNVAIDGGGDNSSFRLSLGNYKSDGVIPNSNYARTTINLFGESTLSPWLRIGATGNYTNGKGTRVQNGSTLAGTMLTLFRTPASFNILNWWDDKKEQPNLYYGIYDNPLFTANRNSYTDLTNRLLGNVYGVVTFTPTLSLNVKSGIDNYTTNSTQIFDLYSFGNDNSDGMGQINTSNNTYTQMYTDAILKYSEKFDDAYDFSVSLGYNNWDMKNSYGFQRGRNFSLPNLYNLSNTNELYASNSISKMQTNAIFSDVALGFYNTLYVNFTGRNEWSSTFGKNGKSFFYPKGDISFVFSELINRANNDASNVLSLGKVRVAMAKAGISPSIYSDRNYYTTPIFTDGYTNGNGFPYLGVNGYSASNVYNPGNLLPESVTGKELGVELRFWKNRFGIDFTTYNQVTNNILLSRPVSPSTGYQYVYQNSGKMQNKGIELTLDLNVIKMKNVNWNIGMTYTKNRNEVLELADGVSELSIESGFSEIGSFAIVGQPYGVFYGTRWQRDAATGKVLVDANGLPLVDPITGKIGDPNPKYLLGLSNSITVYGVNFSFLFDIRKGGDIWNGTYTRLNRMGRTEESADRERTYVIDGIFAPGTPKAGMSNDVAISALNYFSRYVGDASGTSAAENAIQDGSWVRLRSLNLSYRFDFTKYTKHIQYIETFMTARNLWLRTKYKGVDPETSLTGAGSNINGYDYFNNPGTKSFLLGLRIGL